MQKLIGLILLLAATAQAGETFRTFTAQDGRTLKARILSYDAAADKVKIEREDKKKLTVPGTSFSEKDQTYIKKWHVAQIFMSESQFKLTLERDEGDTKKKEHEVDMGDGFGGGRRGGGPSGITTVAVDKITPIKIKLLMDNKSDIDLKLITFEYRLFYEQQKAIPDEKANENRPEDSERPERHMAIDQNKVKKDAARLKPIEARSSKTVTTGTVNLINRSAGFGWGDKIDLKSGFNGAWIRLTMKGPDGDKLVRDITTSGSIMKKYSWDPPDEKSDEKTDAN